MSTSTSDLFHSTCLHSQYVSPLEVMTVLIPGLILEDTTLRIIPRKAIYSTTIIVCQQLNNTIDFSNECVTINGLIYLHY